MNMTICDMRVLIILVIALVTLSMNLTYAVSEEVSMGTTILAVRYRDGVVVGADTRTSVGGYVSNRYAMKIDFVLDRNLDISAVPPTDKQLRSPLYTEKPTSTTAPPPTPRSSTCCVCRSGSAADTQNLVSTVRHLLLSRRVLHPASRTSVPDVAHLVRRTVVDGGEGLSASLICAGYDGEMGRGVVYSIDLGGTLVEHPGWTASGSGSGYVLGFIDEHFPKNVVSEGAGLTPEIADSSESGDDGSALWTEDEAVEFVAKAIELAMDRDGSSGGCVRIFVIDKNGKRAILRMPKKVSSENNSHDSGSTFGKSLPNFALPKRTR